MHRPSVSSKSKVSSRRRKEPPEPFSGPRKIAQYFCEPHGYQREWENAGRATQAKCPLPCRRNVAGSAQTHISGLFSLPAPPLAHRQTILVDTPSLDSNEQPMRSCCLSLPGWSYRLTWEDAYMAAEGRQDMRTSY